MPKRTEKTARAARAEERDKKKELASRAASPTSPVRATSPVDISTRKHAMNPNIHIDALVNVANSYLIHWMADTDDFYRYCGSFIDAYDRHARQNNPNNWHTADTFKYILKALNIAVTTNPPSFPTSTGYETINRYQIHQPALLKLKTWFARWYSGLVCSGAIGGDYIASDSAVRLYFRHFTRTTPTVWSQLTEVAINNAFQFAKPSGSYKVDEEYQHITDDANISRIAANVLPTLSSDVRTLNAISKAVAMPNLIYTPDYFFSVLGAGLVVDQSITSGSALTLHAYTTPAWSMCANSDDAGFKQAFTPAKIKTLTDMCDKYTIRPTITKNDTKTKLLIFHETAPVLDVERNLYELSQIMNHLHSEKISYNTYSTLTGVELDTVTASLSKILDLKALAVNPYVNHNKTNVKPAIMPADDKKILPPSTITSAASAVAHPVIDTKETKPLPKIKLDVSTATTGPASTAIPASSSAVPAFMTAPPPTSSTITSTPHSTSAITTEVPVLAMAPGLPAVVPPVTPAAASATILTSILDGVKAVGTAMTDTFTMDDTEPEDPSTVLDNINAEAAKARAMATAKILEATAVPSTITGLYDDDDDDDNNNNDSDDWDWDELFRDDYIRPNAFDDATKVDPTGMITMPAPIAPSTGIRTAVNPFIANIAAEPPASTEPVTALDSAEYTDLVNRGLIESPLGIQVPVMKKLALLMDTIRRRPPRPPAIEEEEEEEEYPEDPDSIFMPPETTMPEYPSAGYDYMNPSESAPEDPLALDIYNGIAAMPTEETITDEEFPLTLNTNTVAPTYGNVKQTNPSQSQLQYSNVPRPSFTPQAPQFNVPNSFSGGPGGPGDPRGPKGPGGPGGPGGPRPPIKSAIGDQLPFTNRVVTDEGLEIAQEGNKQYGTEKFGLPDPHEKVTTVLFIGMTQGGKTFQMNNMMKDVWQTKYGTSPFDAVFYIGMEKNFDDIIAAVSAMYYQYTGQRNNAVEIHVFHQSEVLPGLREVQSEENADKVKLLIMDDVFSIGGAKEVTTEINKILMTGQHLKVCVWTTVHNAVNESARVARTQAQYMIFCNEETTRVSELTKQPMYSTIMEAYKQSGKESGGKKVLIFDKIHERFYNHKYEAIK